MADEQSPRWKMPPIVKIYEAIGAIADRRVKLADDHHATVVSSDGSKRYEVGVSGDGREISSNDNASYWQGYIGYPSIAVLLMRGLYPLRQEVLEALRGIPWKELNRRFRGDYDRTIAHVLEQAAARGFDPDATAADAAAALAALRDFAPIQGIRRRPAVPMKDASTSGAPATSPARSGSRPRSRNNRH